MIVKMHNQNCDYCVPFPVRWRTEGSVLEVVYGKAAMKRQSGFRGQEVSTESRNIRS
jgi:hypothetical protein